MNSRHIDTAGSYLIAEAGGAAILWTVNVNTGAANAILTVYNGEDDTGEELLVMDASTKGSHAYMRLCTQGVYAVLASGNADITIGYQ